MNPKILAIIPARGGSKGLPGKNIRPLCGKPLIAHAIDEAKKSQYITRLILSTDSLEIAEVGTKYGAEVPFLRPDELATDTALAFDTYSYTCDRLSKEESYEPDILVILQPTTPLRTVEDIDAAIKLFIDKQADSVVTVVEYEHPIERARIVDNQGKIQNYNKGPIVMKNRADYQKVYAPNGAVFVVTPQMVKNHTYYGNNTYPIIMPRARSADIDTLFDFELAQWLMQRSLDNGNV